MKGAVHATPRVRGRARVVELTVRPRPGSEEWCRHVTVDDRSVLVHDTALLTMRATERRHAPDETGGLLLGRVFRDGEGPYVLVTSAVPPRAGEVDGTRSTIRITASGSDAMGKRGQSRDPAADVVGWFHTHPEYPAYFSSVDEEEQAHWPFALAVGLVISGLRAPGAPDEYAVYVGPTSEPAPPVTARPIVRRAGERRHHLVSDAPRDEAHEPDEVEAAERTPSSRGGDRAGRRPGPERGTRVGLRRGLAIIVVVSMLALAALFLLRWTGDNGRVTPTAVPAPTSEQDDWDARRQEERPAAPGAQRHQQPDREHDGIPGQ